MPKLIKTEYIHFLIVLLCRAMIIACKYALYSDEHIQVLKETKLSFEFIAKQLLAVNLIDKDTDNILTRVSIAMKA